MDKDTERLVQHFRNVDVYEGQRGNLDGISPAQAAIRVMLERKQKIAELELERDNLKADVRAADSIVRELVAERDVILTILGPDYVGEFEVGDKQRPLDSLVSEVLSQEMEEVKRLRDMLPHTADGKLIVLGRYYYGRVPGGVRRMHIDRITIQHAPPDSRCESFRGEHICTSRLYSTEEAARAARRLEVKRAKERA